MQRSNEPQTANQFASILECVEHGYDEHALLLIEQERLKAKNPNAFFSEGNPVIDIATRFAKLGKTEFLLKLISKYPDLARITKLPFEALNNKHIDTVRALRKCCSINRTELARAAASKGFTDYSFELLHEGASASAIARGFAYCGLFNQVDEVIKYAEKNGMNILWASITAGAAFGGYFDKAEEILATANEADKQGIIESILLSTEHKYPDYYEKFKQAHHLESKLRRGNHP